MAGLLDALFAQSGSGGGLLDFLRNNALNQQFSSGLPSDQAQYGSMPQFQPPVMQPQAALPPPNAQPAQGQMPVQAPQQTPQFGAQGEGAFTTGLRALGNPGGAINKIADAVQGFTTGQTPVQRQQTQLYQAYVGAGLSPQQAMLAVLNPQLAGNMMGGGQTDDIKEYQFAKKEDPSLTFDKFMARKKSVTGEYSLTPQYGTDDKGNTVLIQTGKSGEAIRTKLPEGVKISSGVEKIDLGTSWGIVDKRTGQLIGQQTKDIVGKESAEERGKAQGQAQAELPAVELQARRAISKIDEFTNSKGFNEVFGAIDQFRPNWTMSEAGRDALSRFKQLSGTAFLEGRQMLKGGGAITDFESGKAESAIARLERSLSEKDARQALEDFKDAVRAGAEKLRAKASGVVPPAAPSTSGGIPSGWSVKVR